MRFHRYLSFTSLLFSSLCAVFALMASAGVAAAQQAPSPQADVDKMIQQFKKNSPELYDLVDSEKLHDYLLKVYASTAPVNGKLPKGAEEFKLNPPSDLLKPEVVQYLVSHSSAQKIDPKKFNKSAVRRPVSVANLIAAVPSVVLGHVQAGAVEPWPSPEEIQKSAAASKSDEPIDFSSLASASLPRDEERKKLPEIPRCPHDTTVRYQYGTPDRSDTTVQDILFIRTAVPELPDEIFGSQVKVYRYTGDPADVASIGIASLKVQCLPFRMRLSQHLSTQEFGLNALKNYDKEFAGKGELHPYVVRHKDELLR